MGRSLVKCSYSSMLGPEGFIVTPLFVLAVLSLLAWIALRVFRGGFWRADQTLSHGVRNRKEWPSVVAIIPARNEGEVIGEVITSHMRCGYPGPFSIILVDDHSDDDTVEAALAAAEGQERSLEIVEAPPLADGWTGKLSALNHGFEVAREKFPDAEYVLFSDADIVYGPDVLFRLVDRAVCDEISLVSVMAMLDSKGFWGGLLMPAFVFFFQKLYPFAWVNDPENRTAAAAGGCMLVKADALVEAGGLAPIHGSLIDDCALARLIKEDPPKRAIWLCLSRKVRSLRPNRKLDDIWDMVARTAYTQLRYSPLLLAGTVAGMVFLYLTAPLIVLTVGLHGEVISAIVAFIVWVVMGMTYAPTAQFYGGSILSGFMLPFTALLYTAMTVSSALRHHKGQGGGWKGRTFSPAAKVREQPERIPPTFRKKS